MKFAQVQEEQREALDRIDELVQGEGMTEYDPEEDTG